MQTINRFNASLGIFCGPLKDPQSWRKFICGCASIVISLLAWRRLNASYGNHMVTWEQENWKLRPVSNVVLLPCRAKLIELNSTLARQALLCWHGSRRDMDHSCFLSDFRSHQIKLDSEFLWAENLFRGVFSLCLKHAFLKRSVPLNVAKAAIIWMQIRPLKCMLHRKLIVSSLLWLVVVFVFNFRRKS